MINLGKDVFNIVGSTLEDFSNGIRNWFNGLEEWKTQAEYSGDERALKNQIRAEGWIFDRFLLNLPSEMDIGKITDWEHDKSGEFIARIKSARTTIENWPKPRPPGGGTSPPIDDPAEVEKRARRRITKMLTALEAELRLPRQKLKELFNEIIQRW